ncbi:lipid A-modifier LpxR family protein [Rhodoflexus sp.]
MKLYVCLMGLLLAARGVFAQANDHYLHFSAANDVFFQTDRYYTSGLQFAYAAPVFNRLPLQKLTPFSKRVVLAWQGITIQQHIFTPNDLKSLEPLPNDRPYAGHLSVGVFRVVVDAENQLRETVSIQAGVMGRPSFGEAVQKAFHEIMPAVQVQGWGNQLGTAVFVQGNYLLEKALRMRKSSELRWQAIGSVGLLRVEAGAGLHYRIGQLIPFTEYWLLASKNRPGEGLQAYVFINPQVMLRAYDATLQGGYFGLQNSVERLQQPINRAIGLLKSGFMIAHSKFGIGLHHTFATPEFRGALVHNWVTMDLAVRF